MEAAYIDAARTARIAPIRLLILIALIVLFGNFILNPRILTEHGVNAFNNGALVLGLILGLYYLLLRTRTYRERPIWDLAIFAPISFAMAVLASALGAETAKTGWPPTAVITGNAAILVPFVVICFVASVRWFALWCIIQVAVFITNCFLNEHTVAGILFGLSGTLPATGAAFYTNLSLDRRAREAFAGLERLREEKVRTEGLLYNVLPRIAADKLRTGGTVADSFSEATVVFIDLVGSSNLAKSLPPSQFVSVLNRVFLMADHCAEKFNIEKVKTIGDAYLAISGTSRSGGAPEAIKFAVEVIEGVANLATELSLDLKVRIGIHSGPVVGGVIGELRVAYDYWGDTMNIASRIQQAAAPNALAVSRQTYHLTRHAQSYAPPRIVLLKGIGEVEVFDAVLSPRNIRV
jgi:class 3 adenylate cyclase